MARLVVCVAVFMLFASCAGTPLENLKKFWQKSKSLIRRPIKLDMAPNSVDDMYDKCEDDMERKVKTELLQNEINKDENFKEAWRKAENYYNKTWAKNPPPLLEKEQIMALHAYTLNVPPLYSVFNKAVRKQKSAYKTTFLYHSLHFYLTRALQTIKGNAGNCVEVFRRTNCKFSKNVINKEIRLGGFSSSSLDKYPNPVFGTKSCFNITTCFGADISQFSSIQSEKEVLIPPYEIFKVTEIKESSKQNKLPCEVVYTLQSTNKNKSNLNCALFKGKHGFN